MRRILVVIGVLIVLGYVGATAFVAVDESEIAVITQFGRPVEVVSEPGLVFKLPEPFQTTVRLDRRLQSQDSNASEYLTKDKKNLVIRSFILWRIADAERFLRTVQDIERASVRLSDLVSSELGVFVGRYNLSDFLRIDGKPSALREVMGAIGESCRARALADFGVELVDVRVRRLGFPRQNLRSVYNRMEAERERIAKKYLAEGKEKADEIRAKTKQETRKLLSDAYRDAQVTRGAGEAKATRIYGEAYGQDPEFYRLLRTLESYGKLLDGETTLVLDAEGPLFRYLNEPPTLTGAGAPGETSGSPLPGLFVTEPLE